MVKIGKKYFISLKIINNLSSIDDYNSKFQVLARRVDNISDQNLLESYVG
jgi:hypothetical protein